MNAYISGNVFLWENTIEGVFSSENPNLIKDLIEPLNLPLVYDISHSFISFNGNQQKLYNHLQDIIPYVKYFHFVDSLGQTHNSLQLGKGGIDWNVIMDFFQDKPYIYEIGLNDINDAKEMIDSHNYILELHLKKEKKAL